jgi:zinc protease
MFIRQLFTAPRLRRCLIPAFALFVLQTAARAQNLPEPRRETLLNGLKLVMQPRPNDNKIILQLRIHSGAAFDLAGKSGTMGLLSDVLFYDPTTRESVEKDLGGKLEVALNHDALDITLAGEGNALEPLIAVIRSAIININPLPENERILALRAARVKLLSEPPTASAVADQMALSRFFGAFPYSRPSAGIAQDLATVDRNDLIFLRERFLNPNNATLVISGNFDPNRAYRVARQLLGNWRKSDVVVPSSFRLPEAPDDRVLVVNQPDATEAQVRLVLRGVARNDRDYFAVNLLTTVAQARWQAALSELPPGFLSVRHDARTLPGFFLLSGKVAPEDAARALQAARATLEKLAAEGPTQAELDRARAAFLGQLHKKAGDPEGLGAFWLDNDTYRLAPFADQLRQLNGLTSQDLKKTSVRLFRAVHTAALASGPADRMRPELEKTAQIEVFGVKPGQSAVAPQPTPKTIFVKP